MPRAFTPKVVTANDLMTGDAVWLTDERHWTREHGEAALAGDKERADALLAFAGGERFVVGPYLADAGEGPDGRAVPTHFREVFRTRGPSNRAHGKQETA